VSTPADPMAEYSAAITEAARRLHPSWGVRAYRDFETRNGIAFRCELTANGRVVAEVDQQGNGGATEIIWSATARADGTAERFNAEAAAIFPGEFEADSTALEALLSRAGL